jgi:uncharacterized protein (DUF885 family)
MRKHLHYLFLIAALAYAPAAENPASRQLNAFIDKLPAGRYDRAVHDFSAASFEADLRQTRERLAELHKIDTSQLNVDEKIDYRFAESILMGREIEQSRVQSWKRNPQVYLSFRGISQTIGRPGKAEDKAAALVQALQFVPRQLANGQKQISIYVPRFQELAVFMAENSRSLFGHDVPAFAESVPDQKPAILEANGAASAALDRYITFLKNDLPKRPKGDFAIGKETYNLLLEHQYMIPYNADTLYDFGWTQFNRTVAELEQVGKRIDPKKTWKQLAEEIKEEGPAAHEMIEKHQEWVDKAKQHILSHDLIPIPWKERVQVVPRAEYLRKTSYYGNFSGARAENADGVLVGQWQINPFEDQWDDKTKHEYMVEHDWAVIIVTAPHETYGGHHVQGLYQLHNPRKIRRENSISIFSEGWGLYNEQLMRETGFFPNDRILLRQLQLRLWRNARVIWDVGIHTGKMSYEEAISLLSDKVGFQRWAAQLEVDGSTSAPGYRIGYFMGMTEILKMREEFKQKMGSKYSLKDFHEHLLKVGSMPPALMREGLMASIAKP